MRVHISHFWAAVLSSVPFLAPSEAQDVAAQQRLERHAALFDYYSATHRVENTAPNAKGIIDLSQHMLNSYAEMPGTPSPASELGSLAHRSTLVILGTATKQESALNSHRSFVFSDWTIKISQIFKNASSLPLSVGDEIVVVRSGGDLTVNGQRVTARDRSFPDFVIGDQYIMYLPAAIDSASFPAVPGGVFDFNEGTPALIADPRQRTSLRTFSSSGTADSLIRAVQRSVTQ